MMSNTYTNSTRERVRREVNAERMRKAMELRPEELREEAKRREHARTMAERGSAGK